MTAENTEPTEGPGGDDLRARYLPVSRKELRRRREAELALERGAATAAAESDAAESDPDESHAEEPAAPSAETPESLESETAVDAARPEELSAEPQPDEPTEDHDDVLADTPESTRDAEPTAEPGSGTTGPAPWGFAIPTAPVPGPDPFDDDEVQLPEDRPESDDSEDVSDAPEPLVPDADPDDADPDGAGLDGAGLLEAPDEAGPDEAGHDEAGSETVSVGDETSEDEPSDLGVVDEAGDEEEILAEELAGPEPAGEEDDDPDEATGEGLQLSLPEPPRMSSSADSSSRPRDLPETELDDQDDAPVPASRKSRRSLRATGSLSVLSEDKLAELQELNQAVAAADDPHRVDPELLKKQQALAARAMQANQERLRQEQVEADRDAKMRRRRLRPESEVITRKALRAHMESDDAVEQTDYATGSIEPIQARGAHGLEIDAMVEHSTRQGARQSMMGWLVIILAVLLLIAVGVVLSFIL